MTIVLVVLAAGLLSITAIVLSFIPLRTVSAVDSTGIDTVAALDEALATQRSMRIAALQQRMIDRSNWSYALLGIALLLQIAALVLDRFTHIAIAVIGILPPFFIVFAACASRRRETQHQLDAYLRSHPPMPTT
jgi:hypothetical protein